MSRYTIIADVIRQVRRDPDSGYTLPVQSILKACEFLKSDYHTIPDTHEARVQFLHVCLNLKDTPLLPPKLVRQ